MLKNKIHVGSIQELKELAKKRQLKEYNQGTKEYTPISESRLNEICEQIKERGLLQ